MSYLGTLIQESHHFISDISNLFIKSKYNRFEKMHIGYGSILFIHQIGASAFTSRHYSNKLFLLKDMLHMLHIAKNLLNVSKFTKDSNVYFEFIIKTVLWRTRRQAIFLFKGNVTKFYTSSSWTYWIEKWLQILSFLMLLLTICKIILV